MVTIKDVAREAGVAISTVSNVFNNVGAVSEQTKQKVLAAVEKLHYIPNMNAKLLKSKKRNTIGLFLNSVQEDYYRELIQAIHLQCKANDYYVNIYLSNDNISDEIYGMIVTSGVAGAIICQEKLTNDYAHKIAITGMPIVFIDRECRGKNISSVTLPAAGKHSFTEMGTACVNELLRFLNDTV